MIFLSPYRHHSFQFFPPSLPIFHAAYICIASSINTSRVDVGIVWTSQNRQPGQLDPTRPGVVKVPPSPRICFSPSKRFSASSASPSLALFHMIRPFDSRRLPHPRDGDTHARNGECPNPLQLKGRRRPIPPGGWGGGRRSGQVLTNSSSPHDSGYGSAPGTPYSLPTPPRLREEAGANSEVFTSLVG